MNFFSKIKSGFGKTTEKISGGISSIFTKKKLDDSSLEELEELLITSDIGPKTASEIINELAKDKFDKEVEASEVKDFLAQKIATKLEGYQGNFNISGQNKPYVIQFVGVNGSGKTTTIGKIANKFKQQGKKVLIIACDTFRAAAVEQLEAWAERANVEIFKGAERQDPASVAYQGYEKAKNENFDIVIIDTAGRLQNKAGLMEELAKISRVLKKHDDSLPHKTVLVIDGITGQNGLQQAKIFKEFVNITGVIITKLDGTAKGGIAVAIAESFQLPIYAIGIGEKQDDLKEFEAEAFARNLVGI